MSDEKKVEETKEEISPEAAQAEVKEEKKEKPAEEPKAGDKKEHPKVEEKIKEKEDKEEVKVPKKFKSLVEEIEKMSVLDLSELVSILEDKFGVSASAPAIMPAPGGSALGGMAADAAEEKSEFNVELTDAGANKIAVIKAVKAATGLGLADAKALVDGAPKVIKENVKKEEAEAMKKAIEEAGGKVELK